MLLTACVMPSLLRSLRLMGHESWGFLFSEDFDMQYGG